MDKEALKKEIEIELKNLERFYSTLKLRGDEDKEHRLKTKKRNRGQ